MKSTHIAAAFLLIVLLTVSFTGCKQSADNWHPAGFQLASSEDADYKFWVPNSWMPDLSTGVTSAYCSKTDRSNITLAVFSLSDNELNYTIDEFWAVYSEDFVSTFGDMEYVNDNDRGTSIILDGMAATKYVYTATVTGVQYQFMQTVSIRAGYVYIFTYTALPDLYESHLEEVNDMLRYFSFDGSTMGENSVIS